jgi:alpha-galactosidase
MIHTLENAALQLTVNSNLGRWSVVSREWNSLALENVQIGLHYRAGYLSSHILDRWRGVSFAGPETVASPHGPLRQMRFVIDPGEENLHCTLLFALPEEHPLLLWQLVVENRGMRPINIDRLELLSAGFIYPHRSGLSGGLLMSPRPGLGLERNLNQGLVPAPQDIAFFSNGWQSWSYTGMYRATDRFRRTRLGPIRAPTDVDAGTPQPRRPGLFVSHMFGALGDRSQRTGLLTGFLSQIQHFGALETITGITPPALRLWANGDGTRLAPGARLVTDWACLHFLHLDSPDPLGPYLEAVARQHGLDSRSNFATKAPTGWCSWYQFSSEGYAFGTVTEQNVRENLAAVAGLSSQVPLQVIQIDDGFESQVGDWFSFNSGFPNGLAPLAAKIRDAGFTPGLWLSPFIVHPRSVLVESHPEWLLRGRLGRPVNAGYFWGSFSNALDLTHPEALAYASEVIRAAVHDWGFSYLKLDFLYVAALRGRYRDPTRTRAHVLRAGLETLRAAAGDQAFLLGCSCPLGPAIGIVDAMRIGADTSCRWLPAYKGRELFLKSEPNLPSARNASHNAITRAALHRRWWINDPDCLLLRPETELTLAEIQSLATVIALTGGSLFLSDHLPDLPPDRLRIAETLLPLIGKRPHILDWLDNPTPGGLQLDLNGPAGPWHLLAIFNWEDQTRDLALQMRDFYLDPQEEYIAREFWKGETFRFSSKPPAEGQPRFQAVPPHGVVLLAVRPHRPYRPQYLGGNLHISQGLEVSAWNWEANSRLSLQLQRPGRSQGHIELSFPHPPKAAFLDGRATGWEFSGEGRYRFAVGFDKTTALIVHTRAATTYPPT